MALSPDDISEVFGGGATQSVDCTLHVAPSIATALPWALVSLLKASFSLPPSECLSLFQKMKGRALG